MLLEVMVDVVVVLLVLGIDPATAGAGMLSPLAAQTRDGTKLQCCIGNVPPPVINNHPCNCTFFKALLIRRI
jgi:hypothetical protein